MTYRSIVQHFRGLLSGDRQTWRYLPYQLSMICRGIDLSGVKERDIGLSEECSYRDSGGPDLDKLLQTLPVSRLDTVLDIGCGKAGAMLTLARYPFAQVDGVELSPRLAQIAQHNLRRLAISNAKIFCRDAAEFTDLDRYTYFYMYNPFIQEIVMRSVMGNIVSSLRRHSRTVTLIYKNPLFNELVVDMGFRKFAEAGATHLHHPFRVYVWDSMAAALAQGCPIRV